ncbi:MAG TPA: hypothetical protein DCM87_05300 [Planctomycetes bacterium]|nr:hypothetical protein [Planctomycetota bacterium]
MPAAAECLILFTRYPEPGTTKTRLIPALGAEGAARLQRRMTERAVAAARALARSRGAAVRVAFSGGSAARMRRWLGNSIAFVPQAGADLGERMLDALQGAFAAGHRRVVLAGTDCPGLGEAVLAGAFDTLPAHDLVLGPALDGGYYLIGMARAIPELFAGIPWSTEVVFERTRAAAAAKGLRIACTQVLGDIDRPEDLQAWQRVDGRPLPPAPGARIAVVIPAYNEAERIAAAIARARTARGVEVFVADGESTDDTAAIAARSGAHVIRNARGRAVQSNAGAAAATAAGAEILLFLHADTLLPEGYDDVVRALLARPGTAAGAFELRIEGATPAMRLIATGANLRSRAFGLPYGDQALFLTAAFFRAMGGFPPMPIMEDFAFVRHLARRGRIAIADAAVTTSARRWRALGPLRTTLVNQAVILGCHLGIAPATLAAWYWRRPAHVTCAAGNAAAASPCLAATDD